MKPISNDTLKGFAEYAREKGDLPSAQWAESMLIPPPSPSFHMNTTQLLEDINEVAEKMLRKQYRSLALIPFNKTGYELVKAALDSAARTFSSRYYRIEINYTLENRLRHEPIALTVVIL